MATGRGKKEEQRLATNAETQAAAIQPTPVETKLNADVLGFLNDIDSGKDVKDISLLKPNLDLFNAASSEQQNDRQSNGIVNLATGGAGANAYKQYLASKRQQDAAGQLENAYNSTYANVTGQTAPYLIGQANSRNLSKAQLAQQQYQAYLNRPKQPSFLDKLLAGAQRTAASAAMAA